MAFYNRYTELYYKLLLSSSFSFLYVYISVVFLRTVFFLGWQVLDEGKLVEFDEPFLLLQNEDSLFSKMVEHTSKHLSTNLYDVARQSFFSRHGITDEFDLDMIPRTMDGLTPLQQQEQQPQDEDFEPDSPRIRRSSSLEKEKLLFVSTV